mgnify:CR=1 FL=1
MTNLPQTLANLYDLDEPLLIALEAFIRKHFSKDVSEATYKANIGKFIECPATLFKLLEKVVYDDLGGFSYVDDWTIDWIGDKDEPLGCVLIHNEDGREATELWWLKDSKEVELKEIDGYWG